MPSNSEEECKERFRSTTNDRNETKRFANRYLIVVVGVVAEL
jgi:hypothetical protein